VSSAKYLILKRQSGVKAVSKRRQSGVKATPKKRLIDARWMLELAKEFEDI
jgi:hypothetical protein